MDYLHKYISVMTLLFLAGCLQVDGGGDRKRAKGNGSKIWSKLDALEQGRGEPLVRGRHDHPHPTKIDPYESWQSFLRHSDNSENRKNNRAKKKRRKEKNLLAGIPGPPGPQGPAGARGPAGAQVTLDVLLRELDERVRVESEKRARALIDAVEGDCFNATRVLCESDAMNAITAYHDPVPMVTVGFHQRLRANIMLQRKSFTELKFYHRPFGGGAFVRGDTFNSEEGRFTAPVNGVYQFTVNAHLVYDGMRRGLAKPLKPRDNVHVIICIQSLCQRHTSLEAVSGLETNSRTFSLAVSGLLFLEAGQYTSVFVDNGSSSRLTVLEGSDFSGILMGV